MLGYYKNQNGVKPIKTNRSNNIIGRPEKCEGAKVISVLDSTPVQVHKQPVQKNRQMQKLLKKDSKWEWTTEIDDDFEKLKKEITEAPCLAHFDPKKDNYVTTDACNTGLGGHIVAKRGGGF